MKNPLPFAWAAERGLRAVFDACAVEPACHHAFPDLERKWQQTMAHFESGPVSTALPRQATDGWETVNITRGVFADGIRHLLYTVQGASNVPRIIEAGSKGDFAPFAQLELNQAIGFANLLSMGMFMSVTCAEDVQFIHEDEIGPATVGTFLGDYRIRRQQAACRLWNVRAVPQDYLDPVRVDTPTLLISGAYDTATPYEGADFAARFMPNSRHVIVPNQSHGYANPRCEFRVIADVFAKGTPDGVDVACLYETKRPPFVVD